jgi:hypothetical protein
LLLRLQLGRVLSLLFGGRRPLFGVAQAPRENGNGVGRRLRRRRALAGLARWLLLLSHLLLLIPDVANNRNSNNSRSRQES